MIEYLFLLGFFVVVLAILYAKALHKISALKFSKQSLSTKYGKMTEQFMPFVKKYPYDVQNFRFLGSPVDGVQFDENKIVFVEFKSSDSKFTKKQVKIKEMVEKGQVFFEEHRI